MTSLLSKAPRRTEQPLVSDIGRNRAREGEREENCPGGFWGFLIALFFYAELCEAIFMRVYTTLWPWAPLLCLSHRLPSTRPFGSPRKSPSIFMPCIHVSVRVCIDIKFRTHQRARTTIFVFQSWRSHLMRPLPAVYTPRQLHNFVGLLFFFFIVEKIHLWHAFSTELRLVGSPCLGFLQVRIMGMCCHAQAVHLKTIPRPDQVA